MRKAISKNSKKVASAMLRLVLFIITELNYLINLFDKQMPHLAQLVSVFMIGKTQNASKGEKH